MKRLFLLLAAWAAVGPLSAQIDAGLTPVATNVWVAPNRKMPGPKNRVLRPRLRIMGKSSLGGSIPFDKKHFFPLTPRPTPFSPSRGMIALKGKATPRAQGSNPKGFPGLKLSVPGGGPASLPKAPPISVMGPATIQYPTIYQPKTQ